MTTYTALLEACECCEADTFVLGDEDEDFMMYCGICDHPDFDHGI